MVCPFEAFLVEVSAGFGYVIRGKQVLQQTDNASRGSGIAASVSDHVDDSGKYIGELAELVAGIRKIEATLDGKKGTTWLRKIADEGDKLEGTDKVLIFDDLTDAGANGFSEAARRAGGDPKAKAFMNNDGIIHLRRSRGNNILVDFSHEMQHSFDLRGGGLFKQVGSRWYVESLNSRHLNNDKVFRTEFRAYRVGNVVANAIDGSPRFANRIELFNHILLNYKDAGAFNPY